MGKFILEVTREEKQIIVIGILAYLNLFDKSGVLSEEAKNEILEFQKRIRDTKESD